MPHLNFVKYCTTQCHLPGNNILHTYCLENCTSHTFTICACCAYTCHLSYNKALAPHCISSVLNNRRLLWLTSDFIVLLYQKALPPDFLVQSENILLRGTYHREVGCITATFQRDSAVYFIYLFPLNHILKLWLEKI